MRATKSVAAMLAFAAAAVLADETKNPGPSRPSSSAIIDLDGCRLPSVFARCGYPTDAFAATDTKKHPTVCLDYGNYLIEVRDKNVIGCYFFGDYDAPVLGCKLGDSPEEVIKKLGKPRLQIENEGGKQAMFWDFKDHDRRLQIGFKDNKCKRIVVSIK
jgi:hypothetical protein